jgi:hypothetical protein
MIACSPHYGSGFRIELVDAATDKTFGTGILTTQSLLQEQRDFLIEERGVSFLGYLREAANFTTRRRIQLGLRLDMKTATSSQYFSPSKSMPHTEKAQKGEWLSSCLVCCCLC